MEINEIAKLLLEGKTCENCRHYIETHDLCTYGNGQDKAIILNNIKEERTCINWKEDDNDPNIVYGSFLPTIRTIKE